MNLKLLLSLILLSVFFVGCVRDEARPVSSILADAQGAYNNSDKSKVPAQAMSAVSNLDASLAKLLEGNASGKDIAGILQNLTSSAGYTARPALDELSKQYRALDDSSPEAAKKLLVARTYMLLTSELESTAFRVG